MREPSGYLKAILASFVRVVVCYLVVSDLFFSSASIVFFPYYKMLAIKHF